MDYQVSGAWITVFGLAAMWELIWKGLALWRAAIRHQSGWYIVMLVINTVGILPIVYLLTHKNPKSD